MGVKNEALVKTTKPTVPGERVLFLNAIMYFIVLKSKLSNQAKDG